MTDEVAVATLAAQLAEANKLIASQRTLIRMQKQYAENEQAEIVRLQGVIDECLEDRLKADECSQRSMEYLTAHVNELEETVKQKDKLIGVLRSKIDSFYGEMKAELPKGINKGD